jgi:protein-S-isoprenylcysteine O-methyltransferase Ste14
LWIHSPALRWRGWERPPRSRRQKLVVTGLYRYVRNPIYIAVVAVILGQALLFGDGRLLWYGALLWLFFMSG